MPYSYKSGSVVTGVVILVSFVCLFAVPLCDFFEGENGCGVSLDSVLHYSLPRLLSKDETKANSWNYPGYIADPGRVVRRWFLLGLSLFEADFGRRMFIATLCGAVIGFERHAADRPAGIRTMSLTSLGACLFTICSTFAFMNGPNEWDASRISAALPSGVGFLGAGIIWKGTSADGTQTVRGLTTAASTWISAACGTAIGGGLYFPGIYGAFLTIVILKYGPRLYLKPDFSRKDTDDEDTDADSDQEGEARMTDTIYGSIEHQDKGNLEERASFRRRKSTMFLSKKQSKRMTFDPHS